MLVRLVWTPRFARPQNAAEAALLSAAAQTPFYAGRDPSLAPPVSVAEYRHWHAEFRNRRAPAPALAAFRYPLPCMPRTALLAGGLRTRPPASVFPEGWTARSRAFAPQAIAAPLAAVRLLARRAAANRLAIPSLTHAVIAFIPPGAEPVAEADRDLVWRAFGVPLFEQWLGFERELLAWECAAHEGLHLTANVRAEIRGGELLLSCLRNLRYPVVRLATGLAAELREEPCPCGRAGPRLVGAALLASPRAAAAAAAAR